MIAEEAGDLPPEKVQALITGLSTSFSNEPQQVGHKVASALVTPRVLPTGLYHRAVDLLGHAGLTGLTVLLGYFTCVSLRLNAYDVPSNVIGLER